MTIGIAMIDVMRKAAALDLSAVWGKGISLVLSLLNLTLLLALAGGVANAFLDLRLLVYHSVEEALRTVIVDTLIILAVVEVFKTTLAYVVEGRVKVTFIIDTILVVMLTEIISEWFTHLDVRRFAVLGAILITLAALRVVAVRVSPGHADGSQDAPVPIILHSDNTAVTE